MLVDPEIGLPYGKLPRLITAWLTREAKRTKSRELVLGRSLNEFAGKLGLSKNGGPVRFLVCRGHETITEITSYDRCNRDQEEQEPEGAEAVPR
nr:replication protein RepA [Burkholderia multivorans]